MRNLHNIEKSGFRRGEYVGYGGGRVWRIWQRDRHAWTAHAQGLPYVSEIRAETLTAMSDKLARTSPA
jgi:hypothetical protein